MLHLLDFVILEQDSCCINWVRSMLSMCCLLLGYSLDLRLNSRALCTAGSSIGYDHLKRMVALWIPVWREKTRLTSSEVRGSVSSKAWRKFSPSISKKTNEDVCSIAFVINSFNGRRFLEFTEPNWKIYCTIFLWYKI